MSYKTRSSSTINLEKPASSDFSNLAADILKEILNSVHFEQVKHVLKHHLRKLKEEQEQKKQEFWN